MRPTFVTAVRARGYEKEKSCSPSTEVEKKVFWRFVSSSSRDPTEVIPCGS